MVNVNNLVAPTIGVKDVGGQVFWCTKITHKLRERVTNVVAIYLLNGYAALKSHLWEYYCEPTFITQRTHLLARRVSGKLSI